MELAINIVIGIFIIGSAIALIYQMGKGIRKNGSN